MNEDKAKEIDTSNDISYDDYDDFMDDYSKQKGKCKYCFESFTDKVKPEFVLINEQFPYTGDNIDIVCIYCKTLRKKKTIELNTDGYNATKSSPVACVIVYPVSYEITTQFVYLNLFI